MLLLSPRKGLHKTGCSLIETSISRKEEKCLTVQISGVELLARQECCAEEFHVI